MNSWRFLFHTITKKLQIDSIFFLRKTMERDFSGRYFKLKSPFGNIQGIIILNKKFFSKEKSEIFLDNLTKKFYLNNNNENLTLENLLIINEPNAGRYEFHQLDKSLLKSFLNNNFNIISWNYSGYSNDDKNFCTMESVKSNLNFMIETLKKHIKIKKLILYGKSMGGFVTIENIHHANYTIIDRSFWNISTIPRIKFNKTIQIIFDLFTSNFFQFNKIFNSKGKVCIIYDPNDEIIPLRCSVFLGVFCMLSKIFFNSKNGLGLDNEFKKDYFNYIRDMKIRFKKTEKLLNFHKKIEIFLSHFCGGSNLPNTFKALCNIYKILTKINLKNDYEYEVLNNLPDDQQTQLNDIKEHIKNNPTENHIWERKELHHEYWESVIKINDQQPELKKFFIRFFKLLKTIKVATLSVNDIFFNNHPDYANFILFLWTCFLYENKSKFENNKNKKFHYYDKHYIKNCELISFDFIREIYL